MSTQDGYTSETEPLDNLKSLGQGAANAASTVMQNSPTSTKAFKQASDIGKKTVGAGKNSSKAASGAKAIDNGKKAADGAKKVADGAKKAADAARKGAEATKLGAEAGAAAATGGAALIPEAAVHIGKKAFSATSDLLKEKEENKSSFGTLILISLIMVLLFCYGAGYYNTNNSSSQVENHEEVEYTNDDNGIEKSKRNKDYVDNNKDSIAENSDHDNPYIPACKEYKEKTDEALKKAFTEQAKKIVEALGRENSFISKFRDLINKLFTKSFTYNEEKTKNTFWDNPYPYCRYIDKSKKYYSIGDYLKTVGFTNKDDHYYHESNYKIIPLEDMNNDLNYVELTAVMSQGSPYRTHGGKYDEYVDLFNTPDNQKLMFEMTVEGMTPWYYGYEHVYEDGRLVDKIYHGEFDDPDHPELEICDEKYFYYKVKVKPFGLRELYKISGVEEELLADDLQPGKQASFNHPSIENIDFLDEQEKYDRVYCRLSEDNAEYKPDYLGPSCLEERNKLSLLIGETHTVNGEPLHTGRSANWYIPLNELINVDELADLINGKTTTEELKNKDYSGKDAVVPVHNFSGNESAFLEEIKEAVMRDMAKSGVLASLTAAQALLESGHGTSGLTKKANALFGIKGSYNGMSVTMMTREEVNGQVIKVPAAFRAYNSWDESISDHSNLFLKNQKRYGNLIGETDYKQACYNVKADGYATDSGYAGKLISIIEAYHLDEWDREVLGNN